MTCIAPILLILPEPAPSARMKSRVRTSDSSALVPTQNPCRAKADDLRPRATPERSMRYFAATRRDL
jgi:hypothetical protein